MNNIYRRYENGSPVISYVLCKEHGDELQSDDLLGSITKDEITSLPCEECAVMYEEELK